MGQGGQENKVLAQVDAPDGRHTVRFRTWGPWTHSVSIYDDVYGFIIHMYGFILYVFVILCPQQQWQACKCIYLPMAPTPSSMCFLPFRDHLDVFRRSGFEFLDVPLLATAARREQRQQQQAGQSQQQDRAAEEDGGMRGFDEVRCEEGDTPHPRGWDASTASPPTLGGLGASAGGEPASVSPPTSLMLSSVPFSRNTTLGLEDVLEMVAKLREGDEKPSELRPSRIRAMLAR